MDDTLRMGDEEYGDFASPGGMSPNMGEYMASPGGITDYTSAVDESSVNMPEEFYRSKGRNKPTKEDVLARLRTPSPTRDRLAQCICELCECGKHSCPIHSVKKTAPWNHTSTYSNAFVPHRHEDAPRPQTSSGDKTQRKKMPFTGEASYQRDYQPPPQEAFVAALSQVEQKPVRTRAQPFKTARDKAKFDGVSTHARDYVAPPMESLRPQLPPEPPKTRGRGDNSARFGGDSQMRRDYVAPPAEAYMKPSASPSGMKKSNPNDTRKFDGDSQMRRDFVAPPKEAYHKPTGGLRELPAKPKAKFDGDTQMRRDFVAPPQEVYTTPRGARGGGNGTPGRTSRKPAPFLGESTSKSHFTNPPRDTYMQGSNSAPGLSSKAVDKGKPKENRDFVTTHSRAYKPPPSPPPRCRASVIMAGNKPPGPPSGREHVYYDATRKKWM